MIVLGYSGLDASVRHAKSDPDIRRGEERMVQGLDSAAALLIDGRVVAAAAEERFSFEKHTNEFPKESIRYCLKTGMVSAEEIDVVAHGFDYQRYKPLFGANGRYDGVLDPQRQLELWQSRLGVTLPRDKFVRVPHHLAHAASTYFPSGFDEALCVVCDGMGETESLTVYAAQGGRFEALDRFGITDSLGILYGLVTFHLGFKFNADEYKVMGLAPYGNPERFRGFFERIVTLRKNGNYKVLINDLASGIGPHYRNVLDYFTKNAVQRPEEAEYLPQEHCDFAAAAQECIEKVLFHVIQHWQERTGLKKICLAGGVALNCTFNGKLLASGLFDEVFIQPAAGDDGTALGAAMLAAHRAGETMSPANQRELPLYGPEYASADIAAALRSLPQSIQVADLGSVSAAATDAARALAHDEIVAWFQGRMEYGPRALGSRSILANPLVPDIKDRLNRIIKLREGFRPFAPAVTVEKASDYFDFVPSPIFDYMLATCPVRPEWRKRLPGITHVDGSARMQTVDARQNAHFHRLISAFGALTGVHCVVNTSFNLQGQPIIVSPEVAVETFQKVRIDKLYMGSWRLSKGS